MQISNQLLLAQRLSTLIEKVGFTIWQLQELENTVATYLVVRFHAHIGIGAEVGEELLKKAEGRPLGSLLTELSKYDVMNTDLLEKLRKLLNQRNWLVHRARRENRGILASEHDLNDMIVKLDDIADQSLSLQKKLAVELENYVLSSGIDRKLIDQEAERLINNWGLIS